MPDTKISAATTTTPPLVTDMLPLARPSDSTARKVTLSALSSLVLAQLSAFVEAATNTSPLLATDMLPFTRAGDVTARKTTVETLRAGVFNVQEYANTQAALDALVAAGFTSGRIVFPHGSTTIAAPLTVPATLRGLEFVGQGIGVGSGTGTRLNYTGAGAMISQTGLSMFSMRDLFWRNNVNSGGMLDLTTVVQITVERVGYLNVVPGASLVVMRGGCGFFRAHWVSGTHNSNTVPTFLITTDAGLGVIFGCTFENMTLNSNAAATAPAIVVSDESGVPRQSIGPLIKNVLFEMTGGGAIRITSTRQSVCDSVVVADVSATPNNPMIEYKRFAAGSDYTYTHTLINCNVLGGTAEMPDVKMDNEVGILGFLIQSCRFGYLDCQSSDPIVINSIISNLVGATSPIVLDAVTIPALTPGSVLFADAGGLLSQDNANLFWDDTNNRLGIGTAEPSVKLAIAGALSSAIAISVTNTNVAAGSSANLDLSVANSSDADAFIRFTEAGNNQWRFGMDTSDNDKLKFSFNTALGGAGDKVTIAQDGNVGIGTITPTAKLQVVGLASYADNAAAVAGGLSIGAFYYTGDILKVVHA